MMQTTLAKAPRGAILSICLLLILVALTVLRSDGVLGNRPPAVNLSARDSTIAVDGSTILTASVSDHDRVIVTYAFHRDGNLVQSGPLEAYSYSNPTLGSLSFIVKVTDDLGATATSDVVNVDVSPTGVQQWADVNGDGIYDQVLATIAVPPQSDAGYAEVTVDGVVLKVEQGELDDASGVVPYITVRLPESLTVEGYDYQLQYLDSAGNWVNSRPALPGSAVGIIESVVVEATQSPDNSRAE